MSSQKNKCLAIVGVMLFLSLVPPMLLCNDSTADARYAQPDDISVSPSLSSIYLNAGESKTIYLDIHNKMPYSSDDPNILVIYVYFDNTPDVKVGFPDGNRSEIKGQEIGTCKVTVSIDKYASSVNQSLSFRIMINDPDRGNSIRADASDLVRVETHSLYSSEDYYNKIMGFVENRLPAPFNSPASTAIITFIMWVIIATVVAYLILPLVYSGWKKAHAKAEEEIEKIEKRGDRNA